MTTRVLARGTRFGDIRLTGYVGSGGYADVYEGFDSKHRRLAVKVLRTGALRDIDGRVRFERERAILSSVRTRQVAALVASDLEAEPPWIATEFVDGPSLRERVEKVGRLSLAQALALASVVGEGLRELHDRGVIHRDLSPDNVLIGPSGPVLIDLGIAHLLDGARLTTPGAGVGTPGFVAPEMLDGTPADERTDVYGLARLVAYAVTGSANGRVPTELPRVFQAAVSPLPSDRPGLETLLDEIALRIPGGEPAPLEVPVGASRPVERLPRRFRARTVVAAASAVAVIAAGTAFLTARRLQDDGVLTYPEVTARITSMVDTSLDVREKLAGTYIDSVEVASSIDVTRYMLQSTVLKRSMPLEVIGIVDADGRSDLVVTVHGATDAEMRSANAVLNSDADGPSKAIEDAIRVGAQSTFGESWSPGSNCAVAYAEPYAGSVAGEPALLLAAIAMDCADQRLGVVVDAWLPSRGARINVAGLLREGAVVNPTALLDTVSWTTDQVALEVADDEVTFELIQQTEGPDRPAPTIPAWRYAFRLAPRTAAAIDLGDTALTWHEWVGIADRSTDSGFQYYFPMGTVGLTVAAAELPEPVTLSNPLDEPILVIGTVRTYGTEFPSFSIQSADAAGVPTAELVPFIDAAFRGAYDEPPAAQDDGMQGAFTMPNDHREPAASERLTVGSVNFERPLDWQVLGTDGIAWIQRNFQDHEPDVPHALLLSAEASAAASGLALSNWLTQPPDLIDCPQLETRVRSSVRDGLELRYTVFTACQVHTVAGSASFYRPQHSPVVQFGLLRDGDELLRGQLAAGSYSDLLRTLLIVETLTAEDAEP